MSRSAHPAGPRHADVLPESSGFGLPSDVHDLDPEIWPASIERVDGELRLAGRRLTDLVAEYGTPAFFMDEADVRGRARAYAAAFDGADVYYAGKAFLCTQLARWIEAEGLNLDVCTGGELAIALAADFPPHRLALHGNNKSVAELTRAVDVGVGSIVVDSFDEIERLARIAQAAGVRQRVLIRVTVGVEAHTHEFIATAHEDQKFGFSLKGGDALRGAQAVIEAESLELIGLHSHIGSQIFDTAGFEVAAHRVVGLAREIRDLTGVEVELLNLGGGLGIAYVSGDEPQPAKEIADRLSEIVDRESAAAGLTRPRLAVEPGRAIVGPSAITVYQVGTIKPVVINDQLTRNYISVDGGMSDNIRTALYDAAYTVTLANRVSTAELVRSRVVGKHCESGDIVVRDAWLPADVAPGDLLAVAATGAYCRSMASNYNQVPRPPVIGVCAGQTSVLLRRETEDDLLRLDPGWTK
ncbi:diaminopimelate decarboxylase [Jatrophihabitans sp. GAS493]|uniref:diaminopimelate decarboxylase n=1 Tax=Jatrophihabitans sp. GAS493 TaxID=1907575 RepID=UPI000BB912C2|nr:diaminopimelate decarboxylase [Jatrophihabitans sp. GAS493]SOD73295.1 diaminopimelate decarboxylase [Jatrophihabitans sp. GAS493]